MAKRKLSAYNRHVQRALKAGGTMKSAARSWKKPRSTSRSKTRSSKRTRRRYTPMAKKKRTRRRAAGLNLKSAMTGAAIVAFGEPIVDSLIAGTIGRLGGSAALNIPDDALKAAVGYYGFKKSKGSLAKGFFAALTIIGTRNTISQLGGAAGAPGTSQPRMLVRTVY